MLGSVSTYRKISIESLLASKKFAFELIVLIYIVTYKVFGSHLVFTTMYTCYFDAF